MVIVKEGVYGGVWGRQRAELSGVCHKQWALCLSGCDSVSVDQVAPFTSRFWASPLLLSFSLLCRNFFFGKADQSCRGWPGLLNDKVPKKILLDVENINVCKNGH